MAQITIAISGIPGAGSSSVGRELARRLAIQYFSIGQLFKDIGSGNVKKQKYYPLFKALCDRAGLRIPDFSAKNDSHAVINLWNSEFGSSKKFHKIIDRLQQELASKGNIVIDGKLALHMIPKADVKIWIKASIEERAKRISQREGIGAEEAVKIIKEREEKERKEWKIIYGFDYFEQEKMADLIIDASNIDAEMAADEIIEHLEEKEEKNKL